MILLHMSCPLRPCICVVQAQQPARSRTVWPEECAAEVEALLDVDADGGALQHAAHLLSDAHEPAACIHVCV
jgi:hypothetical protein